MSRKLDKLFDPTRLRERWQGGPVPESEPQPAGPPAARVVFESLRQHVHAELGSDADLLSVIFDEMAQLVGALFPAEGQEPLAEAAAKKAQLELLKCLDHLEECVETLQLTPPY